MFPHLRMSNLWFARLRPESLPAIREQAAWSHPSAGMGTMVHEPDSRGLNETAMKAPQLGFLIPYFGSMNQAQLYVAARHGTCEPRLCCSEPLFERFFPPSRVVCPAPFTDVRLPLKHLAPVDPSRPTNHVNSVQSEYPASLQALAQV